jgi:hypothetical protein
MFEILDLTGSIAARKLMRANQMGEGRTLRERRRLPMTETDLESDHADGDGRFQLPNTRVSPLNSTQLAVISNQPVPKPDCLVNH